jgi:hypothetical protein
MRTESVRITMLNAVLILLTTHSSTAQTRSASNVMQSIVEVEKHLPWFWTPWPEGIRDVPYAYEWEGKKRKLNSSGQEVFPPKLKDGHYKQARSFQMEHIPLENGWGWDTRCISQDDLPCGVGPWELPPQKTPEEFRTAREKRGLERLALWDEFLRAFRFELQGENRIHFSPTGTYKHRAVKDSEIFEKIEGDLWFDLQTHKISKMEFELNADLGNFVAKLYKGSHYSIELTKTIDNRYLPAMWSLRMNQRMLTSKGAEETEMRYSNYRKFGSSVTVTFGDLEEPVRK